MRKDKMQELESIIESYKTVKQSDVSIVNGKFLKIGVAEYTFNNGKTIIREELIKNNGYPSASIILPITKDNEVILIIQARVLTKSGVCIELPAGYIDQGENGLNAALRELNEETGYTSHNIVKVGEYYQDQGCSRALNECFIAYDCEKVGLQSLDHDEDITLFLCTYEEMLELVELNYINDAGSLLTIQKANILLKK